MVSKTLLVTLLCSIVLASALRAQWVPLGPEGGSVLTLAAMGRYTFAGTSGGTLYRTSDSGLHWSRVFRTTNTDIAGIAVTDSTIFIASDSLYRSTDSGSSWSAQPYLVGYSRVAGPLAFLGRTLLLASPNGIYRSSDFGVSWERLRQGHSLCMLVMDSIIYVGSESSPGLSRSTDSGSTWDSIALIDSLNDRIQSLTANGSTIFAGSYFSDKIYRSTDNGINWDTESIGLPPIGNQGPTRVITSLQEEGMNLFAGTPFGFFRSSDGGMTWSKISSAKVQSFLSTTGDLFAGTANEGILQSTDHGTNWTSRNTGLYNQTITAFAAIGSHLFVGVDGIGIYRSDDSGNTFIAANHGIDSLSVTTIIPIGNTLVAFAVLRPCYVSTDLGNTWTSTHDTHLGVAASIGSDLVAIDGNTMISTDYGNSWEIRGSGPSALGVVSLVSDGTDLYAPGEEYELGTDIFHSTDSGATWSGLGFFGINYGFAVDGDFLFAGTGPGAMGVGRTEIWRKRKSDSLWARLWDFGGNYSDSYAINSIVSINQDVFVSSNEGIASYLPYEGLGVFHSSDYGDTWSAANEGLGNLIVPKLFVFPPYIFAGTQSASVWRRPLSDFGISSVKDVAAAASSDLQCYPDPVSLSTIIYFAPFSSGYADISIQNLLGAEVAHIFSGELSQGEHNFTWEPTGLPDGIYECLIRMNGRVERLQVVLAR